jgi:hypothetical protein
VTNTVHVVHASTLRDRPALMRQVEAWRIAECASSLTDQVKATIIVLGGTPVGQRAIPRAGTTPGLVRLRNATALKRWLHGRQISLLMGWDERVVQVVGAQRVPCAVVLDGLLHRASQSAAMRWMQERRMPVLVTSPSFGERIDRWTKGRARVQGFKPRLEAIAAPGAADAMRIFGGCDKAFRIRSVLDPVVRLGLAGTPVRCSASKVQRDYAPCNSMLEHLGLPGLASADAQDCGWVGAASPGLPWRGTEPVLAVLEAWANGRRLLLPKGHAAGHVLGEDAGNVLQCDADPGRAAEAMLAQPKVCTRVEITQAWAQACDAFALSILGLAQHS